MTDSNQTQSEPPKADPVQSLASTETDTTADPRPRPSSPAHLSLLASLRTAIAGLLMGIANLIPGVSGGTMILAMGVYDEFIDSVADLSSLRFSRRRIVFLGIVGGCAAAAIVLLAGAILYLLFHYPIAMFALFIGLTLGGAPLLFASLRPVRTDVVASIAAGLAIMVGVFALKSGAGFPKNTAMDLVSGVVGSTTMVLPGISGSYMLLLLDQYDRVVGSVRDLKDGLKARDREALLESLKVVVPVGIGAVIGIVLLSNLLKLLLHRYHRPTVGVLLGVLLGSVIGLWPFTQAVGEKALEDRSLDEIRAYAQKWRVPVVGAFTDKEALIEHVLAPANWDQRRPPPITAAGVGIAAIMLLAGFGATLALSRLGEKPGFGDPAAALDS